MKKFIKKNYVLLSVLSILVVWGCISANQYKQWYDSNQKFYQQALEICQHEERAYCKYIGEKLPEAPDTISVYFDITANSSLRNLQLFAPILIIIVAIWSFHKELRSGYYKNVLTRKSYKEYFKDHYINSLKSVMILPVFIIFVFIMSYFLSGNFNFEESMKNYPGYLFIDDKYLKILPWFSFVYVLNIILHSMFWINLGYIAMKKSNHIFVTLLSSFLLYMMIFIISEIFIGAFLFSNINAQDYFSLANIWAYDNVDNLWGMVVFSITLVIGSTLIVLRIYKDKENVVIENEK
jgi:hypothetical protein